MPVGWALEARLRKSKSGTSLQACILPLLRIYRQACYRNVATQGTRVGGIRYWRAAVYLGTLGFGLLPVLPYRDACNQAVKYFGMPPEAYCKVLRSLGLSVLGN